ncbi:hypothetical protein HX776_20305 [Pseudomonas agarici]|uniref:hypothetical protein n=1 Tax=Pseudomonas agarici TaxID=46677 RepID=UPI0003825133|nr:hypothetical protein [Pseudomonas agarici]NWC11140.1 hypothetical protein [Pseudomonas agarici]SEK98884.1 hypothetical protein SAMN05216604_10982 [Pseudomonas agarici]
MQQNPYATPVAELSESHAETPSFFVVSCSKLIIMNMGTLGYYSFYCYYKNWKNYKQASGAAIYPLARAFFSIIYIFPLLSLIHVKLKSQGDKPLCPPYLLASLIIVLGFSEMLSEWLFSMPFSTAMRYGVIGAQIGWLIFVQRMINRAEGDPEGKGNSRLTPLNYFGVCVGLTLWVLMIYAITVLLMNGELPFGIRL